MSAVFRRLTAVLVASLILATLPSMAAADPSFYGIIDSVQPKIVKIYGAGGYKGLEPYQSGFLISSEGHVLTAWSYVLDADIVTVTLSDGQKFQADFVGADPRLEIAVLKIDAVETEHFRLDQAVDLEPGARVLAFSNLYGVATGNEPASVLKGYVSAKTELAARRGVFETPYQGPVYVLDAMTNNPGAAGGALTDRRGQLVGILGKELRNSLNNAWLNFAIPAGELTAAIDDIRAGKIRPRNVDAEIRRPVEPLTLDLLGIVLVPDVLYKTPPFIDHVRPESVAENVGLKTDDLILFVQGRMVSSCKLLVEELELIDRDDPVRITVMRGQELSELDLQLP
jgi:S1-C subfamily serine protease